MSVTVTFKTNADWTATVSDPAVVAITEGEEKGSATDEGKIKLSYTSLPAEVPGRYATLTIKAGPKEVTVSFMQGKVFVISKAVDLGVDGGRADFSVITTEEYTMKTYDGEGGAFTWAPVTFDKESGKGYFTVAANEGYDARQAYVKFTVPSIQVPHYEVNEETWEEYQDGTEDAVYRIYVNQEGHVNYVWAKSLPSTFEVGNNYDQANATIALFDNKILVSDGLAIHAFNPENGEVVAFSLPEGLPVQSITNDDAGNVIFANAAGYDNGTLEIYAVKASDKTMSEPVKIASAAVSAWTGAAIADNVRASGDVFGKGVVSVLLGGGPNEWYNTLSHVMYWNFTDGVASEAHYLAGPADRTDTIWLSNRGCTYPFGTSFLYTGYDGVYALQFYTGTEWSHLAEGIGDWGTAPNAITMGTWKDHSLIGVNSMAYFDNYLPSRLFILDVTDQKMIAATPFAAATDEHVSGGAEASTSDVRLAVEGNDLVAYVVDSFWGVIAKIKYPAM